MRSWALRRATRRHHQGERVCRTRRDASVVLECGIRLKPMAYFLAFSMSAKLGALGLAGSETAGWAAG